MRLPSLGEELGRYRLERELGRGGMGIVYAARDTSLDREVALKLITPQWAEDPEYRARFEREALSLSRVESQHVVAVHDYGELDGCLYLVTQIVPDGDLLELVRREGALAPAVALDLTGQVLEGLSDAHGVGVVHRDVKPSNVLLRRRDGRLEAVLCDFGIATSPGGDVTRTGALVGSFPYMAPERHQGEQADGAADVYSVGCVLWQLLTGTAPYVGSDVEVAMAHLQAPLPQLPATNDFSGAINLVLARALAKDPADRYRSARAMKADLLTVAELAPDALVLPDVTSIRHTIVPGVVAGLASTGTGNVTGNVSGNVTDREPGPRRRRPVLAVIAASVAVAVAVAATYVVVAVSTATDTIEVTDVAGSPQAPLAPGETTSLTSGSPTRDPSGRSTGKATQTKQRKATQTKQGTETKQSDKTGTNKTGTNGTGTNPEGPSSEGSTGPGSTADGGKKPPSPTRSPTATSAPQPTKAPKDPKDPKPPQQTPSQPPAPAPKTFRCWDGSETYGYEECPALSGVSGVQWAWPANYGCVNSPTAGGARLVILTCQRDNAGAKARVTYTLWKSVAAADDYFTNTKFNERGDNWRNGWGSTWYKSTPSSTYKLNRVQLYNREPVSVTVEGATQASQNGALSTLSPYRDPSQLRGVPK